MKSGMTVVRFSTKLPVSPLQPDLSYDPAVSGRTSDQAEPVIVFQSWSSPIPLLTSFFYVVQCEAPVSQSGMDFGHQHRRNMLITCLLAPALEESQGARPVAGNSIQVRDFAQNPDLQAAIEN